jgi:hypothetical protein
MITALSEYISYNITPGSRKNITEQAAPQLLF